MKHVNIKTINKIKRKDYRRNVHRYSIYLSSEFAFYFNSIKDAEKMLSKINEFLTLKLYEFNDVYIDLFTEYRRIWFNMRSNKANSNKDLFIANNDMKQLLKDLDQEFERVTSTPQYENQAALILANITRIFTQLSALVIILIDENKRLRNYQSAKNLEIKNVHLNRIYYTIKSYPKNHNNEIDIMGLLNEDVPKLKIV